MALFPEKKSLSIKLSEQLTRSMLAQKNVARNIEMGARLDAKREREIKLKSNTSIDTVPPGWSYTPINDWDHVRFTISSAIT